MFRDTLGLLDGVANMYREMKQNIPIRCGSHDCRWAVNVVSFGYDLRAETMWHFVSVLSESDRSRIWCSNARSHAAELSSLQLQRSITFDVAQQVHVTTGSSRQIHVVLARFDRCGTATGISYQLQTLG